MKSGRIALGIILIIVFLGLMASVMRMSTSYAAATTEQENTSAQVIVNGAVSITLYGIPIYFSSMDPGTTDMAANATGGFPVNVSIDGATNVLVNVYLNASDFIASPYTLMSENMSYNVSAPGTANANTTCVAAGSCKYGQLWAWSFNESARLGTSRNTSIYNWITIPITQGPGTYTNSVHICASQTTC